MLYWVLRVTPDFDFNSEHPLMFPDQFQGVSGGLEIVFSLRRRTTACCGLTRLVAPVGISYFLLGE